MPITFAWFLPTPGCGRRFARDSFITRTSSPLTIPSVMTTGWEFCKVLRDRRVRRRIQGRVSFWISDGWGRVVSHNGGLLVWIPFHYESIQFFLRTTEILHSQLGVCFWKGIPSGSTTSVGRLLGTQITWPPCSWDPVLFVRSQNGLVGMAGVWNATPRATTLILWGRGHGTNDLTQSRDVPPPVYDKFLRVFTRVGIIPSKSRLKNTLFIQSKSSLR